MSTTATPANPRSRVITASLVGTTIEFYDFYAYATAAVLVFPILFFPSDNETASLLASFAVFGAAMVARPIGAMVFGHFGDKHGRKATLVASLLTMGIATVLIGVLPTFQQINWVAPLLLLVLRLAQGFALGGEWSGAALVATENAPKGKRAWYGSFPQLGAPIGFIIANFIFLAINWLLPHAEDPSLKSEAFLAWGWRIPFLLSAVLVVIGLIVRLVVGESPEFARARNAAELSAAPVRDVIRAPRPLLIGIGAMLVATGGYYVTSSFFLSYASEQAGVPVELLLNALIIGGLFEMVFVPLAGWLGDKWQPRYVVIVGLIGIAVTAVPLYLLAHTGSFLIITVMLIITALFTGFNYGPIAAVLAGIFPVRVRYTGTSLAYQGAALTAGALTPIVVPTLLGMTGGSPTLIFAYLAVLCFGAAGCVWATRKLTVVDHEVMDPVR